VLPQVLFTGEEIGIVKYVTVTCMSVITRNQCQIFRENKLP